MRTLLILPLLVMLAACGGSDSTVVGTLAEGGVTRVWAVGGPEPAAIESDSFRLEGLRGDTLELRFAAESDEPARMEILGLPAGGTLTLHDVWADDGLAYPTSVEMEEEGIVTINGLRLAGRRALPEQVDAAGTVLAAAPSGDALLIRPADEHLPDLRVVITPATLARTPDGDPGELDDLEFGDSVRVRGATQAGYLIASEVEVPRPGAKRSARRDEADDERSASTASAAAASASTSAAGGGAGASAKRTGKLGERVRERWDRLKGKGSAGKGKGGDKGKGKGKG